MTAQSAPSTSTMAALLPEAAAQFGARRATLEKVGEEWVAKTYTELLNDTTALGLGLIALGVQPGDRVSIIGTTNRAWSAAEFAVTRTGAIVVPIYQTNSPRECQWVIEDSQAKVVICENAEQVAKFAEFRAHVPGLEHVIVLDGEAPDAIPLAELLASGKSIAESELEARTAAVQLDEIFTIIYTSGTTGNPKGCMLTHGNYRAIVNSSNESGFFEEGTDTSKEVLYLFLPLAHSFALLCQLTALDSGSSIAYYGGNTQ